LVRCKSGEASCELVVILNDSKEKGTLVVVVEDQEELRNRQKKADVRVNAALILLG
jgi:hypothetical protein